MGSVEKRVLVTGAEGFIGSHLVERLLEQGTRVTAFIKYNSFNFRGWLEELDPALSDGVEIVGGDVRDPIGIETAMKGCSEVYHLAALIAIPFSYREPHSYVDTNVKGTLNVVQAARTLGVDKVIHTSTSEVYGTARYVPIDEGHPLEAQSPYAATKIAADQMALSYHRSFDVPVAVIRPFNTYGPRQSARAVIPTVISQIASGMEIIRLGSLHPTRDFSFVRDTVDGFLSIAQCDRCVGEVINVGSGFEISIGKMVELISEVMERPIRVELDPQRVRPDTSEVDRLWADASKARELTGWVPAYAGFDGFKRGLAETVDWFSNRADITRYRPGEYSV